MKVITLLGEDFDNACRQLANAILAEMHPDMIIGVKTGGAVVARQVLETVRQQLPDIRYAEVSASRPATANKKRDWITRLLQRLPRWLLDGLRIIEHRVLSWMDRPEQQQSRRVDIEETQQRLLCELATGVVVIIDDAIDSGATVAEVHRQLQLLKPDLQYRVACIVQTRSSVRLEPDLVLYRNQLVRFPFSVDAGK